MCRSDAIVMLTWCVLVDVLFVRPTFRFTTNSNCRCDVSHVYTLYRSTDLAMLLLLAK